ncbi:MAG: glycosyltransferase family A protein [Candidatus Paceibacterota bacterium]|jgi:glycosyltransferase involved in cell wall biosynthesis
MNKTEQSQTSGEGNVNNKENQLKVALRELENMGISLENLVDVYKLEIGSSISGRIGNMIWELKREDKEEYHVYVNRKDDGVLEAVAERDKEFEGLTEEERAKRYWEIRLGGEVRIETPQNPQCEFAFVVPVYNERPERILKQIQSLKNQKDIDPSLFEVIYVVNNDLSDGGARFQEVFKANQAVIEMLRNLENIPFPVYVIDKSSPGNEIENCNVGRARNRGVAEASVRFYENKNNGVLIQTDADTYFEDPEYLSKLRKIVKTEPDIIGIAGGFFFEFDPETTDEIELAELRKKVKYFILKKKWDRLVEFLKDTTEIEPDNHFSGVNMISRSYESAAIGGLIDGASGEDPQFGEDLKRYGAGRGQRVIGMRNDLFVITALRNSDRTAASFRKDFDEIDLLKPFMVPNPLVNETLPDFRNKIRKNVEKAVSDETELRTLLTENGNLIVPRQSFDELIGHIREIGYQEDDPFYRKWIDENFGKGFDLMRDLYNRKYPQIAITEENYQLIVEEVMKKPGGPELVRNLTQLVSRLKME